MSDLQSKLPPEWFVLSESEAAKLEAELGRELPSAHVLAGLPAKALARRQKRDDVLFQLADGSLADVHLTWRIETLAGWPSTVIHKDLDAWKAWLVEDQLGFEEGDAQ